MTTSIRPKTRSRCNRARTGGARGILAAASVAGPLLAACSGHIGPAGSGTPDTTPGVSVGTGGGSGVGGPSPDPGLTAIPPGSDPGTVALKRLTSRELRNTIRDLVGIELTSSQGLPAEQYLDGFNNLAENLVVTDGIVQAFSDTAQVVAQTLTSDPRKLAAVASCDVTQSACATPSLLAFAKRAWRRPLVPVEQMRLTALLATLRGQTADATTTFQLALRAVLTAPQFIFRIETDPPNNSIQHPLDNYELAARLSYFLWSSTPDAPLLAAADAGMLNDDRTLETQLQRMLQDPRAEELVDSFASQWLQTVNLSALTLDSTLYPNFTPTLRAAMNDQTAMLFKDVLTQAIPVTTLLSANYIYVNDELAKLYGIPAVNSPSALIAVPAPAERAGGIVTSAAILAMRSHPWGPSAVFRGEFIMTQLLCQGIPPPPPNVPPLPTPSDAAYVHQTARDSLAQHVEAGAACNACHQYLDPPGLALEHYDALGAYRQTDQGLPITVDDQVALPDGTTGPRVRSAADLASFIATSDAFKLCVTKKVTEYALGRALQVTDDVYAVVNKNLWQKLDRLQLGSLIQRLVLSDQFRTRHGG